MKYIVLFEDNPGTGTDVRARHMPDHLSFLRQNAENIDAAGPLFEPDNVGAGGIWIVNAADVATVEHLVKTDPFWPTGLRKSYRILQWKRVFAKGKNLI